MLSAGGSGVAQADTSCRHTVRRGDTLGRIAKRYRVTERSLMRWNPRIRARHRIRTGQRLKVAARCTDRSYVVRSYVVRRGDTLDRLGKRRGFSVAALRRSNPRLKNPHRIRTGQRLRMPTRRAARRAPSRKPGGLIFRDRYSASFAREVRQVAKRLRMDPNHLLAVIHYETNGTFSPSIRNPYTRAVGLIQFLPKTARAMGTSSRALGKMTATRQLRWVERYLRHFKGKMNTVDDAYLAVFYPAAIGKSQRHVMYRKGSKTYRRNRIHDNNRDGRVTKREVTTNVRERLARGREARRRAR